MLAPKIVENAGFQFLAPITDSNMRSRSIPFYFLGNTYASASYFNPLLEIVSICFCVNHINADVYLVRF